MPPLHAIQLVGFLDGTTEAPAKTLDAEVTNGQGGEGNSDRAQPCVHGMGILGLAGPRVPLLLPVKGGSHSSGGHHHIC
jgi:hypothetical protein